MRFGISGGYNFKIVLAIACTKSKHVSTVSYDPTSMKSKNIKKTYAGSELICFDFSIIQVDPNNIAIQCKQNLNGN